MEPDLDLTDYMKVAVTALMADQGLEPSDIDQGDLNDILVALLPVVSAVLHAYREAHAPEVTATSFLEGIG